MDIDFIKNKKYISKHLHHILFLFFFLLLSACGGGSGSDNVTAAKRGDLVNQTQISNVAVSDAGTMMTSYNSSGLQGLTALYDVVTHKITYKTTDANGTLIELSGLVVTPVKPPGSKSPVISLQHGTIFLNVAPSSVNGVYADLAVMFASQGYVVAVPDYIGYGDTVGTTHPFVHADTLASTTIDMIRATKSMAARNTLDLNGQIFLSGYSEGGFATLAAQRSIELDYPAEFAITASSPGAGSYDMTQTARGIASSTTLAVPAYVVFVLKSYDTVYSLNQLSYVFQSPYDEVVNTSFDGTNSGNTINAQLTNVTADLFNSVFLSSFLAGTETNFNTALADNDIYDWTPTTKTRFFHGPDDITVPYINMTTAITTMQANSAADVASVDCALGGAATTHNNCFLAYFSYTNLLFGPLATDL